MPTAVSKNYTPQERMADGSLRITFRNPNNTRIPEDFIRHEVAQFIHANLSHEQFAACEFIVCVGAAGTLKLENQVQWCPTEAKMQAVPFWVGQVESEGVRYGSRKYSVKPEQKGLVNEEVLKDLSKTISTKPVARGRISMQQSTFVSRQTLVFDSSALQTFFRICHEKMTHMPEGCQYLSDVTLKRLYEDNVGPIRSKDRDIFIPTLVDRGYLVSAQTRLKEYVLGAPALQHLADTVVEPAAPTTPAKASIADTNQLLAAAVKTKRKLQQQLQTAQSELAVQRQQNNQLTQQIAQLQAELATQPDTEALVQERVQAELVRMLESE